MLFPGSLQAPARWLRTARRIAGPALAAVAMSIACGVADAQDVYLRAGIGLDQPASTQFEDVDRNGGGTAPACETPCALYGTGPGNDGAPIRSIGTFSIAPSLDIGIGYRVSSAVRMEAFIESKQTYKFVGTANFRDIDPGFRQSVTTNGSVTAGMLAAYLDLFWLGFGDENAFHPFVGAGIGTARISIHETRMTFPRTITLVPGASRNGLAWMATAGLAVPVSERAILDIAWRYTDYGEIQTGQGDGPIVSRASGNELLRVNFAESRGRLRSNGIRLSLRYNL